MDFYSYTTGGMPSLLSYNTNIPASSPGQIINPVQSKSLQNVKDITGYIIETGKGILGLVNQYKHGDTLAKSGVTGSEPTYYGGRIDEVVIPAPGKSNDLLGISMSHSFDWKPILLIGAGLAAVMFFKR